MLSDITYETILNDVLSMSQAVIIFRAMPKDKADVVSFIKRKNPNKITLAIGDGANDVNMI
jgi:P-type E1-E2 ATPase